MSLEGELIVRVRLRDAGIEAVTIASSRPRAARLLVGRSAAQAAALAPLLFSICGQAQGAAARLALDAACGVAPAPAASASAARAICAESIAESLWRLLLDWPHACGMEPLTPPVAAARRLAGVADAAAASGLTQLAVDHVFGQPVLSWLARDLAGVRAWMQAGGTLPARVLAKVDADAPPLVAATAALPDASLPDLAAAVSAALDADPDFDAAPTWAADPAETGACARHRAHPLLAAWRETCGDTPALRLAARLLDLALALHDLAELQMADAEAATWVAAASPRVGVGVAAAHTARGLLVHQATADTDRVHAYRIVAPTEWNFHPAGALARGLAGLATVDAAAAEHAAARLTQALDPCVAWRVELAHA